MMTTSAPTTLPSRSDTAVGGSDDDPGMITLECGLDSRCTFRVTDVPAVADAKQWRHERRHVLPRRLDVEASPAWRHPYEPNRSR